MTSVGSYYYNQPRVDEVSMIAIMRVGKKEIFMQKLNILEQKIADLIERIKELRADVAQKAAENSALKEQLEKRVEEQLNLQDQVEKLESSLLVQHQKLEKLENSLLAQHQNIETLSQEREMTLAALDNVIESINFLVEHEPQQ